MMDAAEVRVACLAALCEIVKCYGRLHGRVRLQKTMYVLRRQGLRELREVPFIFHRYGPFSRLIADCLQEAVVRGHLSEHADASDEWQSHEYRFLSAPDTPTSLSDDSRDLILRVVSETKDEHWQTLELATTIDFIKNDEGLTLDEAIARSMALKPLCAEFRESAIRLVGAVQQS